MSNFKVHLHARNDFRELLAKCDVDNFIRKAAFLAEVPIL